MGAAKLMRIFGFLSILVGLLVAFGYPTYHDAFSNFEIGNHAVYDRDSGFRDQTIWLAPQDGPIEISFETSTVSAGTTESALAPIMLQINNADQSVHSGSIDLAPTVDGATLQFEIENLPITESALHTFVFSSPGLPPTQISLITMTITGIAVTMNYTLPMVGYVLIGLGAILYLVGGRRKAKRSGKAPTGTQSKTAQIGRRADPAPTKTKKVEKPGRKWGRGDG